MQYAFILNPAAGHGRAGRLRAGLEQALCHAGFEYEVFLTGSPAHAAELAARLALSADAVIAVGGDGTISEVARGLVASKRPVPLGIVPMGTGNDLVRSLGIPRRLSDAVRLLGQAQPIRIDYGMLEWLEEGRSGQSLFVNAIGVGFDAAVAAASDAFKRLPGKGAYLGAVPHVLRRWSPPHVHVSLEHDGTPCETFYEGPLFLMTAANGMSSGGGFLLTPSATLSDGALDVCLVQALPVRRVLQLLPRVFRGTHVSAPEVWMGRTTSLTLTSNLPLPIHADGEVVTHTALKLTVRIVPTGLSVLAPS